MKSIKEEAEKLLSSEMFELKGGVNSSGCWFSCSTSCSDGCKSGCLDGGQAAIATA